LEDDPNDAALIQSTLQAGGIACATTCVQNHDDFVAALEHGGLVGLAAEVCGEDVDRAVIRDRRCHVRPLPGIGALGEQAAELVEIGRRRAEDAVGVVIDMAHARERGAQVQ